MLKLVEKIHVLFLKMKNLIKKYLLEENMLLLIMNKFILFMELLYKEVNIVLFGMILILLGEYFKMN